MWLANNIETCLWPCSLYQGVFTFRNENQRSLLALFIIRGITSMCVFPPLGSLSDGGISLGVLSQRGFEDKRNHTTDPTDISRSPVSPFSPSYSIFHLEVDTSFVPAHGFHFPFPLRPTVVSISTLPRFLSFSPALFVSSMSPCSLFPSCFYLSLCSPPLFSATLPSIFLVSAVFSPSPPNCHCLLNWPAWVFSNVTQQDSICSQCVPKYIRAKMVHMIVFWSAIDTE